MKLLDNDYFVTWFGFRYHAHIRPLREIVISVMNFTIGSHIGMTAIGVLDVPVKFIFCTAGCRMRPPFISVGIQVPAPTTPRRIIPASALGQNKRVPSSLRQETPRIFAWPPVCLAH